MQKHIGLKAKDVSRKPITLGKDRKLLDAHSAMLRYNISRINNIVLNINIDNW